MKLYDIDESKGYPIPVMVEDPLGEYYRQDEVDPVIAALKAEITDLNHTFDMVKAADERALKMYWDAHPDKRRMVPSQVNMDIWLLEQVDRLKDVNGKMVETVRDILDAFWDMSPLEYANSRNLAFMSDAEGGEILKRAREALAKAKEVGNG